jgi:hypothetical protein
LLRLKNEVIDITVAKSVVEERLKFANFEYSLVFVDVRNIKVLKKEAREFLAFDEEKKKIIATAYYANSKLTIFLTNFFLRVNLKKYKRPTKLFSNKNNAIEWLNSFKK